MVVWEGGVGGDIQVFTAQGHVDEMRLEWSQPTAANQRLGNGSSPKITQQ